MWPTKEEMREIDLNFYQKFNIPRIIDRIDGKSVKVLGTQSNKYLRYNRKGYYGMNGLLVG